MKNFRILFFVAVASIFAACDDAIDIKQPGELLPEDTFETVDDLTLGLNAVYGAIPGENHILFTSIFTDEVKLGRANGGQGRDGSLAFLLNNNSGDAASIWLSNYLLINYANRLIKGAENVTPIVDEASNIDETDDYNGIVAEARVLRAYGHLQLLTFFAPDMKDDNGLGVIAVDFIPTTAQKLPRNTVGEVFALINSDLDAAVDALPKRVTARDHVSADFVNALRARIAAYRGRYTEVEAYTDPLLVASAQYVLTKKFSGSNTSIDYSKTADLLLKSDYFKLFRDVAVAGNSNEVIFKAVKTVPASNPTGNFYQAWSSVNSTITGSPFYEVSTALYNKLGSADIRRSVIIDPSAYPAYTVRPVAKYAESKTVPLLGDIKIMRSSELYLLKAEARASASDFQGVADQVNKVRAARYGNTTGNIAVPANAQEAWAAILNERRLELAFEGHRYIDIKRLGTLAGQGIDRTEADFAFNGAYTLDLNDHRWTLPVPRAEASANPSIQQNPGYGL